MHQPTGHNATWLCPDAASRERLLDMDERLRKPRAFAIGVLMLALVPAAFEVGPWVLALLLIAALGFVLADAVKARISAPEHAIFGSWLFAQAVIAFAVAMTGAADSYAMPWFIILLITLPARFGFRAVAVGVVFTSVLVAVVVGLVPRAHVVPEWFGVLLPVAALIAVASLSTALMRSDLEHRTEAIIDGLTGMLNRRSLEHRLAELAAQAEVTRQPVAVIAGDLDHFKRVNDEHGHAAGDAVLVDVAYRLRKRLRAFDLAYRVGGEEFLVLLPGATPAAAAGLAEDLRAAIANEPIAGIPVTMSFGVAGSGDDGFDGQAVVAAADAALYAAKGTGRDRVFMDGAAVAAA
jgi:diguanylate cyclase (GGDEF)-like protein